MAPDAIADILDTLPGNATVLDPMCGSGVVVRLALLSGRRALGFDIDPLAVLMSKVWTSDKSLRKAEHYARELAERASSVKLRDISLPWIDGCHETKAFVDYWFGRPQRNALRRLSWLLTGERADLPNHIRDCLWLALSRIIVTKHVGATLAWDVSHSRPHKVRSENSFDVLSQFVRSVARVTSLMAEQPLPSAGKIRRADCRALPRLGKTSIDAVITSPPYLNAIDYLRGHKMSLIWMGHSIPELRHIRAISLGTERSLSEIPTAGAYREIEKALPYIRQLPSRQASLVRKYAADAESMLTQMRKILRPGGVLVTVVGNCNVRGRFIENSKLYRVLASRQGFHLREQRKRPLTQSRRYLPIVSESSALEKRMKYEVVQVYEAAQ